MRRVQHAPAGLRSDLGLSAQGSGHGGGGYAGQSGDVENAGPAGRRLPPPLSAHDPLQLDSPQDLRMKALSPILFPVFRL